MKKIISLGLTLSLALALSIPAGAAGLSRITTVGELDGAYLNQDVDLMNYDGETITENLPKTTTGTFREPDVAEEEPVEDSTRLTTVGELDGAYLNGDTDLMNYDGETITENLPKTTTGMIQEGGISLAAVDNVSVIKGSALFAQSGAGAHYYAFSGYNNSYSEAFSNIKLPTGFYNKNGARNGYVSLGIQGSVHGIDLGLANTGSGWFPYCYDVNNSFTTFTQYKAPSNATTAKIVVKPVSTTKVHMYIQFLNSAGANVGTAFDRDITVTSGNLKTSNSKIMCRYYRFASLVPTGTDNQSDGTYMTGGQFTNCLLYDRSKYVSWGIGTARMTNVWKVSPSKITLTYTEYNDTFNIRHS